MGDPSSQKPAALVTGGAKRLGRAFIEALAADGHDVIIHYNSSADEAEALVKEIRGVRAIALGADLSKPEEAASLVARANQALGPVGVLVNSASIFEQDQLEDLGAESFHRHMTANTLAPALLTKAVAGQGLERASVVNVLDYKLFNLNADYFSYTLSKAALKTMTEMLAKSLAPKVRINAIAPGLTLPSAHHSEAEFQRVHDDNPLKCGSTPEDLVAALRFFVNTPSVSGQIVCVDGGQHFDPRLRRDVFEAL
ncbi:MULTISPECIES: SDR family oxidoreductase [unclassified Oceanicaulis]|uniref:SDR family oxidoreductase n=1 Tax=unclassified Oceanicaulis TaxID=2632123 RepID=UPI0025E0F0ED|nr:MULTISPECIES: SDR family oxidoreductase [unclassified Oceanicaulis]|tara:strand:- start:1272 stop:2033 length:762 start_codon:yes stop_codon:yes gene_type:complete